MDEPFVSLDEQTADRLRHLLLAVWSARPTTVLMVTHNLREALMLSDRIVVLSPRPAHVLGVFDVRLPRQYRNPQVMQRPSAIVPCEVSGRDLIAEFGMGATLVGETMPADPLRRRLLRGFACAGVGAAMLPCCFGRIGAAAAGGGEFALRQIADGIFVFAGDDRIDEPRQPGRDRQSGRRHRQRCGRRHRQRRQHGRGEGLHRGDRRNHVPPGPVPHQHAHASRSHFRQRGIPRHRRDHRRPSKPAAGARGARRILPAELSRAARRCS